MRAFIVIALSTSANTGALLAWHMPPGHSLLRTLLMQAEPLLAYGLTAFFKCMLRKPSHLLASGAKSWDAEGPALEQIMWYLSVTSA